MTTLKTIYSGLDRPGRLLAAIVFLNMGICAFLQFSPQSLAYLAFVPSHAMDQLLSGNLLTVLVSYLTAMFTHITASHLLFNVVPIYLVGVHIARRKGLIAFLVVYFGGGLAANLAQTLFGFFSDTYTIGASGALAALFGYYLVDALKDAGETIDLKAFAKDIGVCLAGLALIGAFSGSLQMFPNMAGLISMALFICGVFKHPRFFYWCVAMSLWIVVNTYDLLMSVLGLYQSDVGFVAHVFGAIAGMAIAFYIRLPSVRRAGEQG